MKTKILAMLVVLLVLAVGCVKQEKETYGSISGKVEPVGINITVQAIQNGSFVKEANIKEDGTYNITDLKVGKYGLLFVENKEDGMVYVYNNKIHPNQMWIINGMNDTIYVSKNKDTPISINLSSERPHYFANILDVVFKEGISIEKKEQILRHYNSSLTGMWDRVRIPQNKTALEMIRIFKSLPEIEDVSIIFREHGAT